MSQTKNLMNTLSLWDSCHLRGMKGENSNVSEWQLVGTEQAFDLNSVHQFCAEKSVSAETLFRAAWAVVLGIYTASDEICSGFIAEDNSAAIYRSKVNGSQPIIGILEILQGKHPSQFLPLTDGLQSIRKVAALSSLFDTCLSIVPDEDENNFMNGNSDQEHDHLTVHVSVSQKNQTIKLWSSSQVISSIEAKSILGCMAMVIARTVDDSSIEINNLNLITAGDLSIIYQWNDKELRMIDSCVHEVIYHQTSVNPQASAICSWDGNLSYRDLEQKSSHLAQHLQSLGVCPGVIVPFCFQKSLWAVVAMLAILKAGGAPVALNPEFPMARLKHIVQFTHAKLILVSVDFVNVIEDSTLTKLVVDNALLSTLLEDELRPIVGPNSQDIAFIQFTSGSTGTPKGIPLDHGTFCTSAFAQHKDQKINQNSRVLQFAAYSFDASLQEIFTTLMAGGTICIPSEERRMNDLKNVFKDMHINWAFLTPTLCEILQPDDIPSLQTLVIGGEAAKEDFVQAWRGKVTLLNGYGPSESCICCSVSNLSVTEYGARNIGRALGANNLWIARVSNHNLLAPIGAIGELLVQGPTLARGYLNDPEQTALAFIEAVPWLPQLRENYFPRVYKTGDLVRYKDDGTIEFIGRKDSQVKVRGQRIELAEIEHHVQSQIPDGGASAVEAVNIMSSGHVMQQVLAIFRGPLRRNDPKFQRTIGEETTDKVGTTMSLCPMTAELRMEALQLQDKLANVLPLYMIPKLYIPLKNMPINPSGKLDRKALRSIAAEFSSVQISEYSLLETKKREARSQNEEVLLSLWANALNVPSQEIGVEDIFFQRGDSISAIKLASAARERGLSLTVADIFLHPKLEDQARIMEFCSGHKDPDHLMPFSLIEEKDLAIKSAMEQCSVGIEEIEDILPSTAIQRSYFSADGTASYPPAAQLVFELQPQLDLPRFKAAWLKLMEQNSILRTRFIQGPGGCLLQVVVNNLPEWTINQDVEACLMEQKSASMSYGDTMIHFTIVEDLGKLYFVLTIHHSIHDTSSLSALLNQLHGIYSGRTDSAMTPYNRFIQHISGVEEAEIATYWSSLLKDPTYLQYPELVLTRKQESLARSTLTASVNFNKTNITDIELVIRSTWAIILSNRANSSDVTFGLTISGRDVPVAGMEATTGPTTAILPLRVRFSSSETIESAAKLIKNQIASTSSHMNISLQEIRALSYDCATGCNLSSLLVVHSDSDVPTEQILVKRDGENAISGCKASKQYLWCPLVLECRLGATGTDLSFLLSFDENIISEPEAQSLLGHVQVVLQQLSAKPHNTLLSEINHFCPYDYSQLATWNMDHPRVSQDCVNRRITDRCKKQPDATAVDSWDGALSYGQLDDMSSILACHLISMGLKPSNEVVALCFEKSLWTILAILSVIKAGGAFLLLDPSHPSQRLQMMTQGVQVNIVLCSARYVTKAASLAQTHLVIDSSLMQRLTDTYAGFPATELPYIKPDDNLYVFYTSGSTGNPKGHLTTHRAYCSAASAHIDAIGLTNSSRIFQFSSYTFDLSISDMLTGLTAGSCICIPSEEERLNDVTGSMARMSVTYANITPTVAKLLNPDILPTLKTLLLSGEPLQELDLETWAHRVTLMNGYGPSECSPHSAINTRVLPNTNPRNIGRPKSCNCRGWIVDPSNHERLRPIGMTGELVIEGPNVNSGYINDSNKTAAAFIEPPSWMAWFMPNIKPCGKFYKTGDLAYYHADGSLIFVGRKDTQVKLHGQRIELGEVESCVREAIPGLFLINVVVEIVPSGGLVKNSSLVAFLQFQKGRGKEHENSEIARLRDYLSTCLPIAMIPKYYISVESIPVLPSGKIDRRSLRQLPATLNSQQLGVSLDETSEKLPPTSPKEYKLRKIWAGLLDTSEESIGVNDNFFHLGGDSISAIKMVAAARKNNLQLTVAQIFDHPLLADLALITTTESISEAPQKSRKATDLAELVGREWDMDLNSIEDIYPTTPLQQGLIALTTRNHKTNTLQQVFRLSADVDIGRFVAAWENVVSQNPILRTRIIFTRSSILQVVLRERIDWQTAVNLQEYLDRDNTIAFDYGTRLIRLGLVPDRDGAHYFIWTSHHSTYDGWSHFSMLDMFGGCYQNVEMTLPPPFKDFVDYLEKNKNENWEQYWQAELDGYSGVTYPALPQPGYWPLTDRSIEHTVAMPLRPEAANDLTISTIIRAAWALTIGQFTATQDVVFGAVQTGRATPLSGISDMLGPTITVVPVRVQWTESLPILDLLSRIQSQSTSMIQFEHIGTKNIETLGADCRAACKFQNLLVIQPEKNQAQPIIPGMQLFQVTDTEYPPYVLSMQCTIGRNELALSASYDSAVLSANKILEIMHEFEHMLHELSSHAMDFKIGDINPLSTRDNDRLNAWNCAKLDPVDDTVHWAIERQMKNHPERPAVCFQNHEMSYRSLDIWSASLAAHLRKLGVGPEIIVPFCFDKSLWGVVAVLAILRAGGTCVALDPKHPPSRLQQIIQNTEATLILGSSNYSNLFESFKVEFLCVDNILRVGLELSVDIDRGSVKPSNAAFVVFTSGSTGTPKGIVLEHASICATSRGNSAALELTPTSRVLAFASYVFDVAIEDICITLMHGACICIASEHDRLNDLSGIMNAMKVTFADLTPTIARTIDPDAVPTLRTLVLGGETLGNDIIEQWADRVHLFNTYGPAECTIYSTTTEVLGKQSKGGNIGRAIGCKCWVVNQNNHNKPVPVGCIGELLIEGPNVARAYLKDDEKTRNVFVYPAWLIGSEGQKRRCYKTGDLVKYNEDGSLDFVGRKDSQVKINGQRIELEDIEHQIVKKCSEQWTTAVEAVRPAGSLSQQMIGVFFWPTNSPLNSQASPTSLLEMTDEMQVEMLKLKNDLTQLLPAYMIPSAYLPLNCMPTTTTGKLNRKALRSIGENISNTQMIQYTLGLFSSEKRQPRNDKETTFQKLWSSALKISPELIGIEDDFFQLGGESIAAIKLAAAARRIDLQLTVADIFRRPVLSDMAFSTEILKQDHKLLPAMHRGSQLTAYVSKKYNIGYDSIQDIYSCTWLQKDMLEVTRRKSEANTLRYIARLESNVDLSRYCAAWEQVVAENPIFRTRIVKVGQGDVLQVVVEEKIEWQGSTSLKDYVQRDKALSFDYGTALNRFAIVTETPGGSYFVWTAHHATYDGWSVTQVLDMVAKLYAGSHINFGPPFKDLVQYVDGLASSNYASFWNAQLHSFSGRVFPPLPGPSYKPLTNKVFETTIRLPKPSSKDITISTLLRAAFSMVIGKYTNSNDTCFGAIQTGRSISLRGVTDIVGPAITLVPLRIAWNSATTVASFLRGIQDQSASMISYEHIGKDKIAAVNANCAIACEFQTLLIVQPVEQEEISPDGVNRIHNEYPEFLTYGLSVECKLGRETMIVHADYDDQVLTAAEVRRFVEELNTMLKSLCSVDGRTIKDAMLGI